MALTTNPYRLARSVSPSHYDLELWPDLEKATFEGVVAISLNVEQSTSSISLNAVELEINNVELTSGGDAPLSANVTYDTEHERISLSFASEIPPGPATLRLHFRGVLNDLLKGFYRSTYVDDEGTTHTIATTQFEATDARRAFPCWDEPSFKATFHVVLNVPENLRAYSNSPVVSEESVGRGLRRVDFATTMKMSTYLVAFVIGPFDETPVVQAGPTPLRVVYPKGKGHLASYALEAGRFALNFFAEYFAIPYPGEKLDMVAIPDFAFGAMENLGCVTYRETALLIDPDTAALAERQRVATVVAHELAHMWFGDLVTMDWWEGIWLNEAFATFMEVLCTNAYQPEWSMWTDFGIDRDVALQVDGLHSTRPIEYEVISPSDMEGMFDVLTYEKGGSVLRMLEQYLGEDTFRDGIRLYLRRHAYANTVTTDLWSALEEVSGQPVVDLMNSWILQGGYPLVTVKNATISQSPFAYGPASGTSAIGSSWVVPVLTRPLAGGEPTRYLLRDEAIAIDAEPTLVNAGGSGVYRTRYGPTETLSVAAHLGELSELERATVISDAWASLLAGASTWTDFVSLAAHIGDRDEPAPWGTVATAFDFAQRALSADASPALNETARAIFEPQFARLGWDALATDSVRAPQVRAITIGVLGAFGDEAIRDEALKRFERNDLAGDLARTILRIVGSVDRTQDFDECFKRLQESNDPQETVRYIYALSTFTSDEHARDAAHKALFVVRNQDGPIMMANLENNRLAGPAAWRYLRDHWDEALARFPSNMHSRLAGGIATMFADPAAAREVSEFHTSHPVESGQRTVLQNLEKLSIGLRFAQTLREQI